MGGRLIGTEKVLKNLNREIGKVEGDVLAGVITAALFIRGRSQVKTPVVEGNLRNSAYVVSSSGSTNAGSSPKFTGRDSGNMATQHVGEMTKQRNIAKRSLKKFGPMASIGYSAVYALAVHENPRAGKTGGFSPTGQKYTAGRNPSGRKSTRKVFSTVGQWKYLENPLNSNSKRVLAIIKNKAKIRGGA